jgi:hypothetical protein
MPRKAEVDRGAPKTQVARYQRGNSILEDSVRNVTEQRNVGAIACRIKCKWKKHIKKES